MMISDIHMNRPAVIYGCGVILGLSMFLMRQETSVSQPSDKLARDAWDRIMNLGGHGVWDGDMVVISLAGTGISDDDLKVFHDFPHVQTLDLSCTGVGDEGVRHVSQIPALELLIVANTRINDRAIDQLRKSRPALRVEMQPVPKGTINPFTGEPM